jgi:hypothetical protein
VEFDKFYQQIPTAAATPSPPLDQLMQYIDNLRLSESRLASCEQEHLFEAFL